MLLSTTTKRGNVGRVMGISSVYEKWHYVYVWGRRDSNHVDQGLRFWESS